MENRINKIIKFSEDEKYFVLKQAVYKGVSYYMTVKTTPDGNEFTDEFAVYQELEEDGKTLFAKVKDPKILEIVLKYLNAPEEGTTK